MSERGLHTRRQLPLYLIAILIGMGGVLFSRQLDNVGLRVAVVFVSVAVPLFATGNVLARPSLGRIERLALLAGVIMLISGAGFSMSGLPDSLMEEEMLSPEVANASRLIGLLSLVLGLLVVLYSVVRTGEDIEEVGDRFWLLAEQMNEGLLLSSAEGRIVLANRRLLEMFGVKEEDIIGESTTALAREFQMDPVLRHFERRAEGIASEYELSCEIRGEERRLAISGNPIFDRQGRHTGTIGLVRDITDQYRLAQRLERYNQGLKQLVEEQTEKLLQSEERFRQLLVTMNEGFLTLNATYRIRFANDRICEMLGLLHQRVVGRDIFEFLDASGRVHLLNLLAQSAGQPRGELRREMNFVASDGTAVPAVVAVSYIGEGAASETRHSLVVTSVAEQKKMRHQLEMRARELERVNEELRLHDRAKDSFLSNVSHELRTPLSTIQGYLDMFESGGLGALKGAQDSAIKVMRRNVDRLVAQINEIIEFSRMEIRGVHLSMNLFSPTRLIQECVASLQPHALPKDLSINTFTEEGIGPVWADREKIGQVIGILLSNAVKFSDPGGLVQVRLEARGPRDVAIAVSDTGIGISPSHHERIFMKFFQVDASRSRRHGGTGIGLSIAKSIVEAHGGRIELESARGEGSTFTVVLPGALFDATVDAAAVRDLDRLHVVLIASGHAFPETLESVLRRAGCRVTVVENAFRGVRAAAEIKPDAVVFVDTPHIESGEATLTALRQQSLTAHAPIIVCSDADAARVKESCDADSDMHFLAMPFSARTLLNLLRHACFDEPLTVAGGLVPAREGRGVPLVMVLDSDLSLLEWVETALRQRGLPCCCAPDWRRGLDLLGQESPDIVFVDDDLPEGASEEERAAFYEAAAVRGTPVCALTGFGSTTPVGEDLIGVLRKPFTIEKMLEIVETAARRGKPEQTHA
ncbi:MAG TPA: PAS domain S-box protein [Candidatus Hydrogenedentes bacterium]|nr:PAS domain S-box protein [Candidatus Hydrogenedentota bacterium]